MKVGDKISATAARGTPSHIRLCSCLPAEMWATSFQISISSFDSFHVNSYLLLELTYRKPQHFSLLSRCMTKTLRLTKGVATLSWTAAIAGHNWVKYGFVVYLTLQMHF